MNYYGTQVRRKDIAVTNAQQREGYAVVALDQENENRLFVSVPPRMSLSADEAELLGNTLLELAGRLRG